MTERTELNLNGEDYKHAFTEVSFLLEVLTSTINDMIGKSTPSLAVSSGRRMGKKLPIYLNEPNIEKVLLEIKKKFKAGFGIDFKCDQKGADMTFGRCAIREVCKNRNLEIGGDICTMFHYYLAGISTELLGKPVRATPGKLNAGEQCTFRFDSR